MLLLLLWQSRLLMMAVTYGGVCVYPLFSKLFPRMFGPFARNEGTSCSYNGCNFFVTTYASSPSGILSTRKGIAGCPLLQSPNKKIADNVGLNADGRDLDSKYQGCRRAQ